MNLGIGFSPCPNDTFILHALLHGLVDTQNLQFSPQIADVEELNVRALEGKTDITKLSLHTYLKVRENYRLLDSGAALGFGCGPLLIATEMIDDKTLKHKRIAVPGINTTANILLRLRHPEVRHTEFMLFSEIENAVLEGRVDAGVIIHENRFTYADKGLVCLQDLGEWWENETGEAIPLGAFAIKRSLGEATAVRVDQMISRSVRYAFAHPEASVKYVRQHAQEMDDHVISRHINTYVNEFSISLGEKGRASIAVLERMATSSGVIS